MHDCLCKCHVLTTSHNTHYKGFSLLLLLVVVVVVLLLLLLLLPTLISRCKHSNNLVPVYARCEGRSKSLPVCYMYYCQYVDNTGNSSNKRKKKCTAYI